MTHEDADLSTRLALPDRVREAVRREIARGRWRGELPSERHLSEEFGVSRPTVRLALHALDQEGLIRLQRRQPSKIIHTLAAPGRRQRRQKEMVLLHNARMKPDLTSLATLTGLLQQQLHRFGYGLRLVDALPPGTRGIEKSLARIDTEYRPAFYLLASVPPVVQEWIARADAPGLVLGSPAPTVSLPAIEVDQAVTVRHAVEYLVRHGHRRLGLLTLPPATVGMLVGTETFQRTCARLKSRGITGATFTSAARPASIEALVRRIFAASEPPTAIIVTDLELVIGLYTTLGELGLHIPRKVSVLSTGYWPLLDFLRPLPTCYWFSWENIAQRIVRMVDEHRRLAVWPRTFWKLLPTFREGKSVAKLTG